ncbi:hypothetical protein LOH80_004661, partial [Salmonella enterica]|nr:hypothetical protein [Salmonella enterica]EKL9181401.1 hypothetical protein [Salmonella enterica]
MAGFSIFLSLDGFRARYRPSLFPVQGTKAHAVGLAVCGFLLNARRADAQQKERTEKPCPLRDLRSGAFVPGIGMNDVAV